jgi:hypothetical protein
MKTTVSRYDVERAFVDADRKEDFSYEGLGLLFDHLEEMEEETGQEIELDVIAICCEYDENHWEDIVSNYSIDLEDCYDEDDKINTVRQYLEDNTMLVGESLPGTFVYVVF